MRIWLINIGEPLPLCENERLSRMGMLADLLVQSEHQVTWWTSTFDHVRKSHRFNKDTCIKINDNYKLVLLKSISYKINISIMRILNHLVIARKFSNMIKDEPEPDIILSSLPTIELSRIAAEYGVKRGIPVVLDMRDMWPDIFVDVAPKWGQWIIRCALYPMFRSIRIACSKAAAITGITKSFVEWGLKYACRPGTKLDRDFVLAYSETVPSEEAVEEAYRFWSRYNISRNNPEFLVCFIGTMGARCENEFLTVIDAARKFEACNIPIKFVLCGAGEKYTLYESMAKDCRAIIFPGKINAAQIWTLMRMASVGLVPYSSDKDFVASLPNKVGEYLSAGLPVVSSLKGVLEDLLRRYNCGVTYENEDAEKLFSALAKLYSSPDLLCSMSKNAYSLYMEKFIAETVYSSMSDYLKTVYSCYKEKENNT
jgi:glycosyltransferase involved in cell wall biosynthesis